MVDFFKVERGGPPNGTILRSTLTSTLKKNQKARTFFSKVKVKVAKNSLRIPSNDDDQL